MRQTLQTNFVYAICICDNVLKKVLWSAIFNISATKVACSQLGQKNKFQNKVIEDIMLLKFKDLLPILLIVGVTPIFSSDCLNEIDNTIQTGF